MVSVLIPAYNECERIAETVIAVRALFVGLGEAEIIVVDDGSHDNTAAVAEGAGADTVLKQANAGKGSALQTAFALSSGETLLLLDADLGTSAAEAAVLLSPVLSGEADMTIATFPVIAGRGGGMGLVVRLARWGIRRLTGRTMAAPLSGQRAVNRDVIETCGGFASGWGVEIALTVRALQAGYRVQEIPTGMSHRVTGRSASAIMHRAAQFRSALFVLVRLWQHPLQKTAAPRRLDAE